MKEETLLVKSYFDGEKKIRPLNVPLLQSTNFQFDSSERLGEHFKKNLDDVYTRFGHPTNSAACQKIAKLEGAESAMVFSSGMAAISSVLLTFLRPGDHLIAQREIFGQTFIFMNEVLREFGVEVQFIDTKDVKQVRTAIKHNTKLIYIESPSNPVLDIVDIKAISKIAGNNILLCLDGTFATPLLQKSLKLGVDISIHSATKYLNGHNDIMVGSISGTKNLIDRVYSTYRLLGGTLDPHAAFLLLRGMRTLALRMERINSNALQIARFLKSHIKINLVRYPFLEDTEFYNLARSQMTGGGGVVSFEVKGGLEAARKFVNSLITITIATSLGGIESIVEVPYELDFSEEELGDDNMGKSTVTPGFIRLSVGIEHIDDLINDVSQALEKI